LINQYRGIIGFKGVNSTERIGKMRKGIVFLMLVTFGLISLSGNLAAGDNEKKLTGVWEGKLKFQGAELRIVFRVSEKPDGSYSALLDSPDQGATGIPVDKVRFEDSTVVFEIPSIMGMYEGIVEKGFLAIKGTWKQSGFELPLDLERVDKVPTVSRPQLPGKPYPYNEEEVTYENGAAGIKLSGTLTYPKEGAPFPAVILISGSGPQDRDETVFGHKPFLVLADYLTRKGIAVLRVDDRGVGGSTGSLWESTSEDFAQDVLAGIEYLKTRKEIDNSRIGLIGHSEGGIIAPMVAARSSDVAFIVLMAGTGVRGEDLLYMQSRLIGRASGTDDEKLARNEELQRKLFRIVKTEGDLSVAEKRIRQTLEEAINGMSEEERSSIPDRDIYIDTQVKNLLSPWFRFFLIYDPLPALTNVRCPVLALGGDKDLQVPADVNLKAIEEALKKGGNNHVTVKKFEGLNHLFQSAETGTVSEYSTIEETISPVVLETIAAWIDSVAGVQGE